MGEQNLVPIALARKAALFYARGKWGDVTVSEGTPIVGMMDVLPRAYTFTVGLVSQPIDIESIQAHIKEQLGQFARSYETLRRYLQADRTAEPSQVEGARTISEFQESREALLGGKNYGTLVIRARKDRHPAVMAYAGLPFTLIGQELIFALHGKTKTLDPQQTVTYRMGDGDGYPHFFGEFSQREGQKILLSLMDGYSTHYGNRTPRPPKEYAPEAISRYRQIWALVARISSEYLQQISPEYISSKSHSYIPNVPDLQWYRGCAPTAAANILAYWDTRGYPKLVDDPAKTAHDLIDELADAMDTDSSGSTKDHNVDDGIEAVCNDAAYSNNYAFDTDGPDSWYCWGKITDAIDAGKPCHLIVHGHNQYRDHSVTVVGYRRVLKDCAADDYFVTIHDTWSTTGYDVEIPYDGSVDGCDTAWQVTRVDPGARRRYTGCAAEDAVKKAALDDQRILFRLLASKRTTGALAEGFREVYRDAVLSEEFSAIVGSSPERLYEFGRHLHFAAYLGRAVGGGMSDEDLIFPDQTANELVEILEFVRSEASPELKRFLELMIEGLKDIAGNSAPQVGRKVLDNRN